MPTPQSRRSTRCAERKCGAAWGRTPSPASFPHHVLTGFTGLRRGFHFGLLWCQTPLCNYCEGGGGRNAEGAEITRRTRREETPIVGKATLTLRRTIVKQSAHAAQFLCVPLRPLRLISPTHPPKLRHSQKRKQPSSPQSGAARCRTSAAGNLCAPALRTAGPAASGAQCASVQMCKRPVSSSQHQYPMRLDTETGYC